MVDERYANCVSVNLKLFLVSNQGRGGLGPLSSNCVSGLLR